jgi:starch phosphorylase
MVHGVDIWLNTPRRPMEASGTSGMKAAINGALNVSTLDGWWCEGYKPDGGWAIGAGENYDDPAYQDIVESQAVYNMFENEIVPLFYTRSADNLPRAWIRRVKNSVKWITPRFNTHRMIGEYVRRFYNPASARWQHLNADTLAAAKALSGWKANIRAAWHEFAVRDVQVSVTHNGQTPPQFNPKYSQLKVGSKVNVKAVVRLGRTVGPEDVSVELYYGPVDGWGNINNGASVKMDCEGPAGQEGEYSFAGSVACKVSGRQGVAVRLLPRNPDLVNPYEPGLILWESQDSKSPTPTN